jgi:branched-chain amino acid transport system permease protein
VVVNRELGFTVWATMPLGVLFASFLGALFSYVSVRRGLGIIFLGIVTLAFSLVFQNLLLGLREFTKGEDGIVTRGLGFGLLENEWSSYYVLLAVLLSSLLLYHFLMGSRVGLAFKALSDDELTAELAGIDVTRYKVLAALIGSALTGTVGVFFAYYNGFISPTMFSIVSVDIVVLVMLVFGGMATLLGPIFGGAVFTIVNELVRPFGQLNLLIYGALLVVIFLLFREGLVMALRRVARLRVP